LVVKLVEISRKPAKARKPQRRGEEIETAGLHSFSSSLLCASAFFAPLREISSIA
jgi:hypothetical protein